MSDGRNLSAAARGYGHAWRQARAAFLQRNPLCAECARTDRVTLATIVDHVTPHRMADAIASGDSERIAAARRIFWSRENWQSLCSTCHSSVKQRLEKTGRIVGADVDGFPSDPAHHWRRPAE